MTFSQLSFHGEQLVAVFSTGARLTLDEVKAKLRTLAQTGIPAGEYKRALDAFTDYYQKAK